MATNDRPGVSVVICAYTERRWDQTRAALESALRQEPAPAEVLLVVDHNAELADRARLEFTSVSVLENAGTQGLSGARNTGLKAATQPVTAFLDDDAEARPGWLEHLVAPYSSPDVVATGGSVYPRWPAARPPWLPAEFYWVVGCSYRGLPETTGQVRNPIGASMSMLTDLALEVGGFDESVGRVGANTRGCEETELSIRLTASRAGSVILYVPASAVDHHVAPERLSLNYFVRRCWHEGLSKADVVRLAGAAAGLQRERRQTAVVIPAALLREARGLATGHVGAAARISATIAGLTAASAGYFSGRTSQRIHQRRDRLDSLVVIASAQQPGEQVPGMGLGGS
jgi:GT2 family glycosyltransferase